MMMFFFNATQGELMLQEKTYNHDIESTKFSDVLYKKCFSQIV